MSTLIFLENRIFPHHLSLPSCFELKPALHEPIFLSWYQCKSKANSVNVTGVKLEEMREELAWEKSNLLLVLCLSKFNLD